MKISRFRTIPFLTKGSSKSAGRNNSGRITVRHQGKGHKQKVRSIT